MKLRMYMKSGNQVTLTNVADWKIKYQGNEITSLHVEYEKSKPDDKGVVIGSIDLSQIEAMERV